MNDTLRIANDSLKVVLSSANESANNSSVTTEDIVLTIVVLVVIAAGFYYIVKAVLVSVENSREKSFRHEEEMHNLNRIKEERKQLLDFCYDMAMKKESATKDFVKETTITEMTKTSTKGTSTEKDDEQSIDSSTKAKSVDNDKSENTESSTKGTSTENEEISSSVVNTTTKEYKEAKHEGGTITLDQIRQECWLIIKKMNDINDLK